MPAARSKISPQLKPLAVSLASLKLDPQNARQHDERGIASIKASLERFGQLKPVVVQQRGRIVRAGNATVVAARELGWTEIAANVKSMTDAEARAYAIADNRTAELASWDDATLAGILAGLHGEDSIDATVTGYTEEELASLLAQVTCSSEIVEDEVPEPPDNPITKPGDLWLLGDHRMLCGDSTKGEDVERVMGGEKASLLVTDPPYGLGKCWSGLQQMRGHEQVANGKLSRSEWLEWMSRGLKAWVAEAFAESFVGYCWFAWSANPCTMIEDAGFSIHATIVWVKEHFNVGRADYHAQYEQCLYFSRGDRTWCGRRDLSNVWDARRLEQLREHPTQKPVSLLARCIENSSVKAALAFDPFCGSGTTLIAAEQLGRRCYGIEIEPRYVDVTITRWEKLTGKRAKLERTGKYFPR